MYKVAVMYNSKSDSNSISSFTTYQIFNKVSGKKFKIKSIFGEVGFKKLSKLK